MTEEIQHVWEITNPREAIDLVHFYDDDTTTASFPDIAFPVECWDKTQVIGEIWSADFIEIEHHSPHMFHLKLKGSYDEDTYDTAYIITDKDKVTEYCKSRGWIKEEKQEKHNMAQKQSLELVDKWLEEAEQLSLQGISTYDAWYDLTDAMRAYKCAILLDLYDSDYYT